MMVQEDKLSVVEQHPQKSSSTVLQQKTGIRGLDETLNGGIPKYTLTLLAGTSGTGKTIFGFQWLFAGVKQGENGIYISMTEPLFMAVRNIESMEFYDRKVIEQEKLRLLEEGKKQKETERQRQKEERKNQTVIKTFSFNIHKGKYTRKCGFGIVPSFHTSAGSTQVERRLHT